MNGFARYMYVSIQNDKKKEVHRSYSSALLDDVDYNIRVEMRNVI